jgi:hypothetical protein
MDQSEVGDLTRTYTERLDELKRELEAASVAFDDECADGRTGNGDAGALRPKAQAYELALKRYRSFLMDGIVQADAAEKP